MVKIADFFYYNLLKHGFVVIAILGLVVAIIVCLFLARWGGGVEQVGENTMNFCREDVDCFEDCGNCVVVSSGRYCEPNLSIQCGCVDNQCVVKSQIL